MMITAISTDRLAGKGGKGVVEFMQPYTVRLDIVGVEPLLFKRMDVEATETKGKSKKGSTERKTDNIESYLYRDVGGVIQIPRHMFKACLVQSARYSPDPRSPRKSAMELFRAGVKIINDASLGKKTADFIDKRPVSVQRNRVIRSRPAFAVGWAARFDVLVTLPDYITAEWLNEVAVRAGRTCGLGDFRPDFGTFMLTGFDVLKA